MEKQNKNLTIKSDVQKILSETLMEETGSGLIMVLEGQAPEQHNPKPVNFAGTITAPRFFAESRKDTFNPKQARCEVAKSNGKIKLIINEQDECNRMTIEGNVIIGKRFTDLGINSSSKSYTPIALASKFRLLRSIFKNHTDHMSIVKDLRDLKAKVNQEIEVNKDDRGNKGSLFKQTVESNMPDGFDLVLPLLEGEEPQTIRVDVILEADGGDIRCFLESVDAADTIEAAKINRVEEEIDQLDKEIAVMYY